MTAANDSTSGPPSDPQIKRIEAALAQLGSEHQPPAGWQARVLAAVAAPPRRRRPWWHVAMPAMLAAAALLIVLGLLIPPRGKKDMAWTHDEQLVASIEPGPVTRTRGDSYAPGDTAHLKWPSNRRYRDVWVYRNEKLLFRCQDNPACNMGPELIQIDLRFDDLGQYKILAIASDTEIPAPSGEYDTDRASVNANATLREQNFMIR